MPNQDFLLDAVVPHAEKSYDRSRQNFFVTCQSENYHIQNEINLLLE